MKEYDFYIVPTPIGNLGDITKRAIEILKSVDIIACEDMRVTQKLLNHFNIKTKCISYHKFNEKERVEYFLNILGDDKKIALVSDAGTPLFCDPGAIIVDELRKHNFTVTSLAGANAVATFLSQVPRDGEDFVFVGFLPKTKQQIENILQKYKSTDIVFYESPNRLQNTLKIIKENRLNSHVAVGRELTKVFEEIVINDTNEIINYFNNNILKGEIVGLVFRDKNNGGMDYSDKIEVLKSKGFKAKEISIILSELFDANKNEIYKQCIK
jgi:16S rRNA (cytidine1402-2'-O)-methyltransferase